MPEAEGRYERLIFWIVKHVPGRLVALLATISYFGVGLALPLMLDWPKVWWLSANLYGTIFAGSLVLAWVLFQIAARDRRHLLDWTSDLRLLDGQEFEWFVGEIFRREGWQVVERGKQDAADGNVDLELRRQGEVRIVQCKRWTVQWIRIDEVRKLVGTLTTEGLPASAGILVTLSGFTRHAVEEAKKTGLVLVDSVELHARAEKARRSEACPICGEPMVLDRSIRGWWFRCETAGCLGKRDLDKDPGRAVAMITSQRQK